MTNRTEMTNAFAAIIALAGKIDKNQQKVNFLHYMHGRADEAHHWQSFVDNQRVRLASMQEAFASMTSHLSADEIGAIAMEVATAETQREAA